MNEHPESGTAPPASPPASPSTAPAAAASSDDRTMAMLAHLLGIFTWFVGALVIWLMKKDSSPFINDQAREALNFQLTIGIAYVGLVILSCLTLGLGTILFPIAGLVSVVFCIIACVAANKGEYYRYPMNIRLIK